MVLAAVGTQHLAVDPASIRSHEERHHAGDVLRFAQSPERDHLRDGCDLLLRLVAEEQIGRDRAGCDDVHRDAALTQFLGEDMGHGLHRALGGRVGAIGRLVQADDARREADDAPAIAHASRRFPKAIERALEIDGDVLIEEGVLGLHDRLKLHDPGVVDEHVDAAERIDRAVEERGDCCRVAHVGLDGDRLPTGRLDLGRERVRRFGAAGIVDDDGQAVSRQPLGDGRADALGRTCDDGAALCVSHEALLLPPRHIRVATDPV